MYPKLVPKTLPYIKLHSKRNYLQAFILIYHLNHLICSELSTKVFLQPEDHIEVLVH